MAETMSVQITEELKAIRKELEFIKSAFSTSIFTGGESVISPRLEKAGSEKIALSEANMQLVY